MEIQQWGPWCITTIAVSAQYVTAKKRPSGWLINLTAQLACLTYNIVTAQYGFIPAQFVGGYLAVHAYIAWTRDGEEDREGTGLPRSSRQDEPTERMPCRTTTTASSSARS